MSSGKPLDIGRFSVHGWKYLKIKGLEDSFLWIPGACPGPDPRFAGMTKGREWRCSILALSFYPLSPGGRGLELAPDLIRGRGGR